VLLSIGIEEIGKEEKSHCQKKWGVLRSFLDQSKIQPRKQNPNYILLVNPPILKIKQLIIFGLFLDFPPWLMNPKSNNFLQFLLVYKLTCLLSLVIIFSVITDSSLKLFKDNNEFHSQLKTGFFWFVNL